MPATFTPHAMSSAGPVRQMSRAALILTLLAPGAPVTIEAMARAIYGARPRPTCWAASIRSTINGLRRAQSRAGAAIVCGPDGYRRSTGPAAPILLPGRFKRFRGFLPMRAGIDTAIVPWAPSRRAA